jgi:hypothetical protein
MYAILHLTINQKRTRSGGIRVQSISRIINLGMKCRTGLLLSMGEITST